jgi:hypothetical protein
MTSLQWQMDGLKQSGFSHRALPVNVRFNNRYGTGYSNDIMICCTQLDHFIFACSDVTLGMSEFVLCLQTDFIAYSWERETLLNSSASLYWTKLDFIGSVCCP